MEKYFVLIGVGFDGFQEPLLCVPARSIAEAASALSCEGVANGIHFRVTGRSERHFAAKAAQAIREAGKDVTADQVSEKARAWQQMYFMQIPIVRR